jgi:hypothetical protein
VSGAIRRSVQTKQCASPISCFKLDNILTRLFQHKHFPAFGMKHNNLHYIVNVTNMFFLLLLLLLLFEKVKCASAHKQTMILQIQQVVCFVGRDSSVGITTFYRLDRPGIESRWGRGFPLLSRPTLGTTKPPMPGVQGFSRAYSGRTVALTTDPHPAPRLKKEYSYTVTPRVGLRGLF